MLAMTIHAALNFGVKYYMDSSLYSSPFIQLKWFKLNNTGPPRAQSPVSKDWYIIHYMDVSSWWRFHAANLSHSFNWNDSSSTKLKLSLSFGVHCAHSIGMVKIWHLWRGSWSPGDDEWTLPKSIERLSVAKQSKRFNNRLEILLKRMKYQKFPQVHTSRRLHLHFHKFSTLLL